MERRVDWLTEEAAALGLGNVEVVRARAEDAQLDEPLDQVTARAVSALSKLLPLTAALLRAGGEFLFMKGARVDEEITAAQKVIRKLGLQNVSVDILGEGVVPDPTRVFRATRP